ELARTLNGTEPRPFWPILPAETDPTCQDRSYLPRQILPAKTDPTCRARSILFKNLLFLKTYFFKNPHFLKNHIVKNACSAACADRTHPGGVVDVSFCPICLVDVSWPTYYKTSVFNLIRQIDR